MIGRSCFVDTGYWLALYNVRDRLHARALALAAQDRPIVTTEGVLLEVGDALARSQTRAMGVALLRNIRDVPNLEIVPLTTESFSRAVDLYAGRPDKEWGLTDCVSLVVMKERGIDEALAADQHFVQAGFRALLLEIS